MRHFTLSALIACFAAIPAGAQFNTYYKGMVREGGKDVPATAQFSVEPGRVAVVMKGARATRMLFFEKDQVLRLVDDTHGMYLDLGKTTRDAMGPGISAQLAEAQKQLDKLPPAQRAMAQQMLQSNMAGRKPVPSQYVWTQEKKTIAGYETTRVNIIEGSVKKAEYWGTTSSDLKMSDGERSTMLAMQDYLRTYLIMVTPAGEGSGEARAFMWDTSVDGYPVVTRCFTGDEMTLELELDAHDRKALSGDLFAIPSGYKKQEMPTMGH